MPPRLRTILLAGALLPGGCAALVNVAPPVTPAMVAVSGGADAATLDRGRRIFTTQCAACHRADPVTKFSFPEWRRIVAEMKERTKLDAAQESALLAYLQAAPKAMPAQVAP